MEPGFPVVQTADPLPLIRKLLETGAEPDTYVDNTPVSRRNFGGSPRMEIEVAGIVLSFEPAEAKAALLREMPA